MFYVNEIHKLWNNACPLITNKSEHLEVCCISLPIDCLLKIFEKI